MRKANEKLYKDKIRIRKKERRRNMNEWREISKKRERKKEKKKERRKERKKRRILYE